MVERIDIMLYSNIVLLLILLFTAYIIAIILYQTIHKCSTETASQNIQEMIVTFFKNILFAVPEQVKEQEIAIDYPCIYSLLTAIEPFSVFSSNLINYKISTFSKKNIPCILLKFTPKNTNQNFDVIYQLLEQTLENNLTIFDITNYKIHVFLRPFSQNTYVLYILYGTTRQNIENINCYISNQQHLQQKNAKQKIAPIVDPVLEKELESLE